MITVIASLYDKKSQTFKSPFFVVRIEVAVRAVEGAVNNPGRDNDVANYPADFALYELGVFNDETAEFKLHNQPRVVVEAVQFKKLNGEMGLNVSDEKLKRESM